MNTVSIIKPEHLAPIRNLNLRAKLIVEGMIAGLHKSPFHGFSSEFLEYRAYRSGEPMRKIDWRKFAKSDRPVVRLYEDETNLFAHLLVDKSASMAFCSGNGMSKIDYARTLAASIAWILIRQRDAVGFATFDENMQLFIPPKSTNIQLKNILKSLDQISAGSQTKCGKAIDTLASGLKKRGLCVLISDFFDDPLTIIQGLRHLCFKKQDIILLQILDPLEYNFKQRGTLRLYDIETRQIAFLDANTAGNYFSDGMREHLTVLKNACKELKIDFEIITTDEPFQKALLRVLENRRRIL
jgi:uncharacterized protein (DUF58 family)